MYYLIVNCGSTSLKLDLVDLTNRKTVFSDRIERIKTGSSPKTYKRAFDLLTKKMCISHFDELLRVKAVCHRVVHGADKYSSAQLIGKKLERDVEKFSVLAPLHNPYNLLGIKLAKESFPDSPHYAVFDTAFHATIPEINASYALPKYLTIKKKIKKYGFHGINHAYIAEKVAGVFRKRSLKLISCHLGGGCSVTAVDSGRSIDCSMGFTPLSGVPMATRSGDIDPGIIFYLNRNLNYSLDKIENILLKESGLFGLSGFSGDMRDLLKAKKSKQAEAEKAINFFALAVAQKIASQIVLMGGLDAIAFTGGIGENGVRVRQLIGDLLKVFGVQIDPRLNSLNSEEITAKKSDVRVFIIPANEALQMATEVSRLA